MLLDEPETDIQSIDWAALTDRPRDEDSYEAHRARATAVFGSLCALQLEDTVWRLTAPIVPASIVPPGVATGMELLTEAKSDGRCFDALAYALRHLDVAIEDGIGGVDLAALLQAISVPLLCRRLSDPARLVFERSDTLLYGLERHLQTTPLTILIGGASAGRSALAAVLGSQSGRLRYVLGGSVSEDAKQTAAEVEAAYCASSTLRPSELVRFLTALTLAVLESAGVDAGISAFPEAHVAAAGDERRALAHYFVGQLRARLAVSDPAGVLREFFRLSSLLVGADGVTTVLLPFEKLESEWKRRPNPKLWTGLMNLARDLKAGAEDGTPPTESNLRILIMARSVPFTEIGQQGLSRWVLAMPPLDRSELGLRLAEWQGTGGKVAEDLVAQAMLVTGGIPVLAAALLHELPAATPISDAAIQTAERRIREALDRLRGHERLSTPSERLLSHLLEDPELEPGDDECLSRLAGGEVFFDDDLGDPAFERLYRSGLLWFEPSEGRPWSALAGGASFTMAARPSLAPSLIATARSRRGLRTMLAGGAR